MKILAIDSSGLVATVAVLEDDIMTAEYTINHKKTHSQTLLPMIDEITRMIELDLHELDAVAVAGGPGSFTGLRIGSATAKGLGLALDIPLISVPTVDALAYNFAGTDAIVCPMMDARRSQVYTGIYRIHNDKMDILHPQSAIAVEEVCRLLNGFCCSCGTGAKERFRPILLGDGVPVYRQMIDELLQVPYVIAPPHLSRQRAGALASLAAQYLREGRVQTSAEHAPDYLRLSQAERERAEREKTEKADGM